MSQFDESLAEGGHQGAPQAPALVISRHGHPVNPAPGLAMIIVIEPSSAGADFAAGGIDPSLTFIMDLDLFALSLLLNACPCRVVTWAMETQGEPRRQREHRHVLQGFADHTDLHQGAPRSHRLNQNVIRIAVIIQPDGSVQALIINKSFLPLSKQSGRI